MMKRALAIIFLTAAVAGSALSQSSWFDRTRMAADSMQIRALLRMAGGGIYFSDGSYQNQAGSTWAHDSALVSQYWGKWLTDTVGAIRNRMISGDVGTVGFLPKYIGSRYIGNSSLREYGNALRFAPAASNGRFVLFTQHGDSVVFSTNVNGDLLLTQRGVTATFDDLLAGGGGSGSGSAKWGVVGGVQTTDSMWIGSTRDLIFYRSGDTLYAYVDTVDDIATHQWTTNTFIGGTGAVGYVPMFISTKAVTNSPLYYYSVDSSLSLLDSRLYFTVGGTGRGYVQARGSTLYFWDEAGGTEYSLAQLASGGGGGSAFADSLARQGIDVFNVKEYGAVGNGVAVDTSAFRQAINAASVSGGIVWVPPGTYIVNTTIKSNVKLWGAGVGVSILKSRAGSNLSVVISDSFYNKMGGTDFTCPTDFEIANLTIDGNKAVNADSGYGVRLYAKRFRIYDVTIQNATIDGLYTEWGGTAAYTTPAMDQEPWVRNLKTIFSGRHGWQHKGPGDIAANGVVSYQNGAWALSVGASMHLTQFNGYLSDSGGVRVWGNGVVQGSNIQATATSGEGTRTRGILIDTLCGGSIISSVVAAGDIGLEIKAAQQNISGQVANTDSVGLLLNGGSGNFALTMFANSGYWIDWRSVNGSSNILISGNGGVGTMYAGTPGATDFVSFASCPTGYTGFRLKLPGQKMYAAGYEPVMPQTNDTLVTKSSNVAWSGRHDYSGIVKADTIYSRAYGNLPASASTLDGLTDVNVAGASPGAVLKYNGTQWVDSTDETGAGGTITGSGIANWVATWLSGSQIQEGPLFWRNPELVLYGNGDVGLTFYDSDASDSAMIKMSGDSLFFADATTAWAFIPFSLLRDDTTRAYWFTQAEGDAKASTSHNHNLDNLANVLTTGKVAGSTIKWNGTAWVDSTDETGAGGTVTGSGATDHVTRWTGTTSLGSSFVVIDSPNVVLPFGEDQPGTKVIFHYIAGDSAWMGVEGTNNATLKFHDAAGATYSLSQLADDTTRSYWFTQAEGNAKQPAGTYLIPSDSTNFRGFTNKTLQDSTASLRTDLARKSTLSDSTGALRTDLARKSTLSDSTAALRTDLARKSALSDSTASLRTDLARKSLVNDSTAALRTDLARKSLVNDSTAALRTDLARKSTLNDSTAALRTDLARKSTLNDSTAALRTDLLRKDAFDDSANVYKTKIETGVGYALVYVSPGGDSLYRVAIGSGLTFSGGTLAASASAPTFDQIGNGTSTSKTLTVGNGTTLGYTGTGIIDATRFLGVTTVDATEFGYLNGVTGAIQTALDAKTAKATVKTLFTQSLMDTALTTDTVAIWSVGVASTIDTITYNAGRSFVGTARLEMVDSLTQVSGATLIDTTTVTISKVQQYGAAVNSTTLTAGKLLRLVWTALSAPISRGKSFAVTVKNHE